MELQLPGGRFYGPTSRTREVCGFTLAETTYSRGHRLPPYDLARDRELKEALDSLRSDAFLLDKVNNHNPAFGYNSFEGFIEEDCVQAIEQVINEKFKVEVEAHQRWKENDRFLIVLIWLSFTPWL